MKVLLFGEGKPSADMNLRRSAFHFAQPRGVDLSSARLCASATLREISSSHALRVLQKRSDAIGSETLAALREPRPPVLQSLVDSEYILETRRLAE